MSNMRSPGESNEASAKSTIRTLPTSLPSCQPVIAGMTLARSVAAICAPSRTPSDPALWAWQLGAIKPELFTGPMHDARVEDLMRSAKGNLRFSAVSMHRHHDVALVPLLMPMIESATLLEQPFPKCRAFHCFAPYR
jgi:hypothetical protein